MGYLTPEEARKRFGTFILPTEGPVSTLPEIEDEAGTWKPVFDFWLRWIGYELVESPEDHTWDVLGHNL